MLERSPEFNLLFQVVQDVQSHVSAVRDHVVAATDALGRSESDSLTFEGAECLGSTSAELKGALERLGDLQLVLAATTQRMVALDGARRRLTSEQG